MQKDSKILDDLARMGTSAFSSLLDFKKEIDSRVSAQMEKMLQNLQLVTREEHEVVRAMALKAREENEKLESRLKELEKRLDEFAPR